MNLYIKIFATFLVPITLGLLFTIFSLNSVLKNQENLILQNEDTQERQIENRFQIVLENMQRDINILTKNSDIVEAIEIQNNFVLSNWGKAFLGNQYSTVIFINANNTVISRASDQYKFGDTLKKELSKELISKELYRGIFTLDNKEILLYSKKIKDYANKTVGSVILGITIDKEFLQKITNSEKFALKYIKLRGNPIYSINIEEVKEEKNFKTHIKNIDKLNQFIIQKGFNEDIKDLEKFKINILTFTIITCIVIIFLLYFILTNFLRPYKKIYTLLVDFADNKIDFKYIKNISKNIALQRNPKEIHHMARALYKVSKKTLRNEEKLKKISFTDQLTKVLNRRKLDEVLLKESYSSNRYKKELSIVIIDIDHFKKINDTYGHQTGDKILKQFSRIINKNLRETDYFGRWGGEEFLIICPSSNLEGAVSLTNKVRDIIKTESYPNKIALTASFGVGELLEDESLNSLISRTDEALYKAKNNGRDKIEKAV